MTEKKLMDLLAQDGIQFVNRSWGLTTTKTITFTAIKNVIESACKAQTDFVAEFKAKHELMQQEILAGNGGATRQMLQDLFNKVK